MASLSVLIPARNEEWLAQTVKSVMDKAQGETECIVVLDGAWADPPIPQRDGVTVVYHPYSIGQRAAINEAARMSSADFVMKLDAHCDVAEGFDVELMATCEDRMIMVPRMRNLHAFDWVCDRCGHHRYQGHKLKECAGCSPEEAHDEWHKELVWGWHGNRKSDFMRFNSDLRFKYWGAMERRDIGKGDICDLMCFVGAGWCLRRDWYWEIGGCDEGHGSWGQQGVEMACKAWLSGGRVVVNKRTWFAHMFRTQGGDFGFPYPIRHSDQVKAREYSRDLWWHGKWPKMIHPLSWLVEKFWPVPGWTDEDLAALKAEEAANV